MKRRLRFIVVAFFAGIPLLAIILIVLNFTWFSYSRSLKALQAKGERVTFPELAATLSPLTNSMFAAFTNAAAKLGEPPADVASHLEEYASPGKAKVLHRQNSIATTNNLGAPNDLGWSDLRRMLDSRTIALKELRRSLEQPDANAGPWTDYFESRTPLVPIKTAAYWLVTDSIVGLHDGRRADAMTDIQVLERLSDLHLEEYHLATQMPRVLVGGLGIKTTWEALQTKDWDDTELKALQETWEKRDFLEPLERGTVGERSFSSELWRTKLGVIASSDSNHKFQNLKTGRWLYTSTIMNMDLRFLLSLSQVYVEQARALHQGRPWPEVSKSLDGIINELDATSHSPRKFFYIMTLISLPNFSKGFDLATRTEVERRLVITDIALRRYEVKYHKRAPSLNALVPEFLPSVPLDCMDGKPLKYQLRSDGKFVLYSVGKDGVDNGGDASSTSPDGKLGLWDGRDAVWPSSAN
jgi:hypothetical protein